MNHRTRGTLAALALATAAVTPAPAHAQPRWGALFAQPAASLGSGGFGALGLVLTGEVGVTGPVRAYLQYTHREALAGCSVEDGASECNVSPRSVEAGARFRLGTGPRVAPFAGVGFGLHRRTPPGSGASDDSLHAGVTAGLDVRAGATLAVRFSLSWEEVLDGRGARFFAAGLGLGIVVW